jgi:hypothetical protein
MKNGRNIYWSTNCEGFWGLANMNSVFELFAMIMARHSFRRHATRSSGSRQGIDNARAQDKVTD